MEIRPYTASDADAVFEVHQRTFDERTDELRIVQQLHDPDTAIVSLVAVEHGRIVGHILFSPVAVADHEGTVSLVGLAPVGVRLENQDAGVGSALIERGAAACRAAGADAVVVLGDPEYYTRFGFERASEYGLGNEYGDDAFMVKHLTDGPWTT